MNLTHTNSRRSVLAWLVGATLVAGCGGGGSSASNTSATSGEQSAASDAPAVVLTDMQPLENGFAFANFPASWYEDEFVADDLVAMFGSDPSVCVDGIAEPCELTAEAAAFARMVNQSRASGHCEGLVAVAQARFNEQSDPPTANLADDSETIKAIMRAFATQFIPEVRDEITTWLGSSLADKIKALETSLAEGKLTYSLGVYIEDGGHAILPYAIEYLTPTKPRIMIYDSNWPGRNRWVDVDLETETWTFSFSGDDPDNDPDLWSGGADRMDLTSIDSREGSCPFCTTEVGVTKNVLLVRSTDLDWSVETEDGEVLSPENPGSDPEGVTIAPVKGQSKLSSKSKRASYDYMIKVPSKRKGKARAKRTRIIMPTTTSVFAMTAVGIAQVSTPGNPTIPVEVGDDSFVANDASVSLSLASGNLVATASGPTASLEITDEGLKAAVTTEDGQTVEVAVTPEAPAAKIVADPEQGGVQVLAQAADGVVEKRDIAADGTETVTIETTPLNLNATSWEPPPGLESAPLPMLPPPDARNVNNPDYAVDTPYAPPADAVPASETVPPTTTVPSTTEAPATTTTSAPTTTTTVATSTTTTVPPTTTTTTTTAPPTTTTVPRTTTTTTTTTVTPTTTTVPRTTTTTTVPRTTTTVPRTTTTTTTTTTVPPTTAAPPTIAAPTTTTTTIPVVAPSLNLPTSLDATVGDGPMTLVVISDSPALMEFSSSDTAVATITPLTNISARITVVSAGSTTITVDQAATTGFQAVSRSLSLTVYRRAQAALSVVSTSGTVGTPLTLATTGGSGTGAVSYALTGADNAGCSLDGDQLTRTSAGDCTLMATKAGDVEYLPRSSAQVIIPFAIAVTTPTLDLPMSLSLTVGDSPYTLTVLSDSPEPLSFSSGNLAVATITTSTTNSALITVVAEGSTTITVSQSATTGFSAVTGDFTLTVSRRTQASLAVVTTSGTVGTPVSMSTTGGSGTGAITYALSGTGNTGCTISGSQLSRSSVGTCTVMATKAGDATYLPQSSTATAFTFIALVTPTLDLPATLTNTLGDSPRALVVNSNSPAAMTFTSSNRGVATIVSTSATSAEITIVAAGSTTITVSQPATGTYSAVTRTSALTVLKKSQAPLYLVSASGIVDVPLTLSTTGGSGTGNVTYALSGSGNTGCTISGSQITRTSAGTCTVVATKATNPEFLATSSAATPISFVVVNFPTAVTDLQTQLTGDNLDLTWTAAISVDVPLDTHRVRYRRSGATTDWLELDEIAPTSTSARLSSVVAGFAYDIEVAGVNARGTGTAATATVTVSGATPTATEIIPTACALVVGTSPSGEQCSQALLVPGRTNVNKYLNFAETTNQVWVDLGAPYHVTQFQIWTANTARRDPMRFQIYAANGNSASLGTGRLVASGLTDCPNVRGAACGVHAITPTQAMRYVVIQFPEVRLAGDYMEMSRIILHGLQVQAALSITTTAGDTSAPLTLGTSGGSGTGTVSFALVGNDNAGCSLAGDQLSLGSAGTCTVIATRTGDATFADICTAPTVITFGTAPTAMPASGSDPPLGRDPDESS